MSEADQNQYRTEELAAKVNRLKNVSECIDRIVTRCVQMISNFQLQLKPKGHARS